MKSFEPDPGELLWSHIAGEGPFQPQPDLEPTPPAEAPQMLHLVETLRASLAEPPLEPTGQALARQSLLEAIQRTPPAAPMPIARPFVPAEQTGNVAALLLAFVLLVGSGLFFLAENVLANSARAEAQQSGFSQVIKPAVPLVNQHCPHCRNVTKPGG